MSSESPKRSSLRLGILDMAALVGVGLLAGLAVSEWWATAQASVVTQLLACEQTLAQAY